MLTGRVRMCCLKPRFSVDLTLVLAHTFDSDEFVSNQQEAIRRPVRENLVDVHISVWRRCHETKPKVWLMGVPVQRERQEFDLGKLFPW